MMTDRYQVLTYSGPSSFVDGGEEWLQVLDTEQRQIELVGPTRHRKLLAELADALNAKERLKNMGTYLRGHTDDLIESTEPAECRDTRSSLIGDGAAWPFYATGRERYVWTYAAHGVTVVHRTNAMGLQLFGRVVRRANALGTRQVVQLVDGDGHVFASVTGLPPAVVAAIQAKP